MSTKPSGAGMGFPALPDPFPPKRPKPYTLEDGEIAVRFVNTEDGEEKVVVAKQGEPVSRVADRAGVKIAYSCRSGLCGTCTTDLEDPNFPVGKSYRPGHQTIRACVSKCSVPRGCEEMVLDVYRGSGAAKKLNRHLLPDDLKEKLQISAQELPDAMARFSDGWEASFRPDYKANSRPPVPAGAAGGTAAGGGRGASAADRYGGVARTSGVSMLRHDALRAVVESDRARRANSRVHGKGGAAEAAAAQRAGGSGGGGGGGGTPPPQQVNRFGSSDAIDSSAFRYDEVTGTYVDLLADENDVDGSDDEDWSAEEEQPWQKLPRPPPLPPQGLARTAGVSRVRQLALIEASKRKRGRRPENPPPRAKGNRFGADARVNNNYNNAAAATAAQGPRAGGHSPPVQPQQPQWQQQQPQWQQQQQQQEQQQLQQQQQQQQEQQPPASGYHPPVETQASRQVKQQRMDEEMRRRAIEVAGQAGYDAALQEQNFSPDFSRAYRRRRTPGANEKASQDVGADMDLVPDFRTGGYIPRGLAGMVPSSARQGAKPERLQECKRCGGGGTVPCELCGGQGYLDDMAGSGERRQCYLCMTQGAVRCSSCGGMGMVAAQ